MNFVGFLGSRETGSWFFCKGFQVLTQSFQLCLLHKNVIALGGGGALMLARALIIREAVHTFPIAALSPGEEFRNDGKT